MLLSYTLHSCTCRHPAAVHMHDVGPHLLHHLGDSLPPRPFKGIILRYIMHRTVLHRQRILRGMRNDMHLSQLAKPFGKHLHISRSTARRAVDTRDIVNDFHFKIKDFSSSPGANIIHSGKMLSEQ